MWAVVDTFTLANQNADSFVRRVLSVLHFYTMVAMAIVWIVTTNHIQPRLLSARKSYLLTEHDLRIPDPESANEKMQCLPFPTDSGTLALAILELFYVNVCEYSESMIRKDHYGPS